MWATSSFAREAFKSTEDCGKWITYYYLHPEPDEIPGVLIYFSESPASSSNVQVPVAAFFAAIFKKNATLMRKTFDHVSAYGGAKARVVMTRAIYLTFTPESRELLAKAKESWFSEKVPDGTRASMERILRDILEDLQTAPLEVRTDNKLLGPEDLDCLWMTFAATGEKEPILKLISLIHLKEDGRDDENVIGAAAAWSLGVNAKTHKRILEICREEVGNAQGTTKTLLENIIREAENPKAHP